MRGRSSGRGDLQDGRGHWRGRGLRRERECGRNEAGRDASIRANCGTTIAEEEAKQ